MNDRLACTAHKSLEIFDQCRLWQQNHPASPDDSAAWFEGTTLKQPVLNFLFENRPLSWRGGACLRAY